MKPAFEVSIGCEEWQSSSVCASFEKAQEVVQAWEALSFCMGAYSATYGWIENLVTGEKEDFLQSEEELEGE